MSEATAERERILAIIRGHLTCEEHAHCVRYGCVEAILKEIDGKPLEPSAMPAIETARAMAASIVSDAGSHHFRLGMGVRAEIFFEASSMNPWGTDFAPSYSSLPSLAGLPTLLDPSIPNNEIRLYRGDQMVACKTVRVPEGY
jgi:hypothetical protein